MKLFIGGSRDGQRINVPDVKTIQVPLENTTEKYHKTVVLGPQGNQAYVYLHESIPQTQVAQQLIKGYKP